MFIEEDNRLFLQHGPINIVLEAFGIDKNLAYRNVKKYFETILDELVLDLELLKNASAQRPQHKRQRGYRKK